MGEPETTEEVPFWARGSGVCSPNQTMDQDHSRSSLGSEVFILEPNSSKFHVDVGFPLVLFAGPTTDFDPQTPCRGGWATRQPSDTSQQNRQLPGRDIPSNSTMSKPPVVVSPRLPV